MSNRDRVIQFLRNVGPAGATNEQIVSRTGIKPHPQVFQITRELMQRGKIKGMQSGKEWRFWIPDAPASEAAPDAPLAPAPLQLFSSSNTLTPAEFEAVVLVAMAKVFGARLIPGRVPGVPKLFDCVSDDGQIVGDAKFYTLVQGERLPQAKFSVIAEHVWLLEKTGSPRKFLAFGNDRRVPELWLRRYGHLASGVEFYFVDPSGIATLLGGPATP